MAQKHDLRILFLQTFITELIKNTKPGSLPRKSGEGFLEKTEELELRHMPPGMVPSKFQIKKPMQIVPTYNTPVAPQTRSTIPGKIETPITQKMQVSPKPSTKMNAFPQPSVGTPITRPAPGNLDVGKLNLVLGDQRIESIECPGPNKNVLVRKDGTIQRTKITLTKEEIQEIINDFSEKTRIPLIGGTFKAALGNIIMTAVTSDFVGSRFILQKRSPFQNLVR